MPFLVQKKLFIMLSGLFLFSIVVAQETNLTDQEYSRQCLTESRTYMSSLAEEGFNTLRINDTLNKAQTIYDSQVLISRQGRSGEFGVVIDSCEEIKVLYELAFKSRDDIGVFEDFYSSTKEEGMNTESVDAIINQIENHFQFPAIVLNKRTDYFTA